MLTVTVQVNAPGWTAQGVKEQLAMLLERFGDTQVVSVTDTEAGRESRMEQYRIGYDPYREIQRTLDAARTPPGRK